MMLQNISRFGLFLCTMVSTLLIIVFFVLTELAAWFCHKYIMHGPGWFFHHDHHRPKHGFAERNDVFFLIFAIPSWLLIMFGLMGGKDWRLYAGLGIALYGLCYFLVHDVFIHQRVRWFGKTDNFYLRAIRKAHKVHHKQLDPRPGECFGLLIVPWKYYREALKSG